MGGWRFFPRFPHQRGPNAAWAISPNFPQTRGNGWNGLKHQEPQTLWLAALSFSEGDGTRTRNHRIDSPVL